MLGQNRKLRKENKCSKNAIKKYLHKTVAEQTPIDNIYNMGNFPLDPDEMKVLNKGLSFVCAPAMVPKTEALKAFLKLKRRMLLHYHFHVRPNKNQKIKIFKLTSNWQPPNYEQKALQTFFKNVAKDLQTLYDSPVDNNRNLSHGKVTALRKLETRQEMAIKPADKGGKIVLWPTDKYMEEAEKQLQDKKHYEEQVEDKTPSLAMEIETFVTYLLSRGLIDEDCYSFLAPLTTTNTPTFYMLPKIHKEGCPGRPIISGCQSPTVALSQYLDFYLKPIVKVTPS